MECGRSPIDFILVHVSRTASQTADEECDKDSADLSIVELM